MAVLIGVKMISCRTDAEGGRNICAAAAIVALARLRAARLRFFSMRLHFHRERPMKTGISPDFGYG